MNTDANNVNDNDNDNYNINRNNIKFRWQYCSYCRWHKLNLDKITVTGHRYNSSFKFYETFEDFEDLIEVRNHSKYGHRNGDDQKWNI